MTVAFGWHLILDMVGMNENIKSVDKVREWVETLVKKIDMIPYGEARVERFGEGHLLGVTAVQLIMTSSITAHFVDCDGSGYIDVFSCKPFDDEVVIEWTKECFGGGVKTSSSIVRG